MVQIPRLYSTYKSKGLIKSFQDMLDSAQPPARPLVRVRGLADVRGPLVCADIFEPLFAVSVDPSVDRNLHLFLQVSVLGRACPSSLPRSNASASTPSTTRASVSGRFRS
jgi:hypothetical protein